MKKIMLVLCGIFLISLVSATISCDPPSLTISYAQGDSVETSTYCTNTGNSTTIFTTGETSLFSTTETAFSTGSKTIPITFEPTASKGLHSGTLSFGDGSPSVPIFFSVNGEEEEESSDGCRLIELPHTTTYRIKQGETGASGQIRIKVSTECENSLSMSVTEETQMSKPMYLQGASGDVEPGGEFSFSIGLDGEGVSTGTYSNSYIISAYNGDDVYQKSIYLTTIVTVGTTPADFNQTFTQLPTCSLDADMSINQTYSLICNNENPNIDIEVPYNNFFQGVGVSESEGRFEYQFKPTKIGNTVFLALFKYRDVPIGNPFSKEVKIFAGGTPVSGTELDVLFYQSGIKKELESLVASELTILVKDSKTQNIVPSFTIYVNGDVSNNSFVLEADKEYELIVDSTGYVSRTLNFTVSEKKIEYSISPESGITTGTNINITLIEPVNASIFIDGSKKGNSFYGTLSEGVHDIELIHKDYENTVFNITVHGSIYLSGFIQDEFKKGVEQTYLLNENASWVVYWQEDETAQKQNKASGTGNKVIFTPDAKGFWIVEAESKEIGRYEIEGWTIPGWDWLKNNKLLASGGFIIIVFTVFVFARSRKSKSSRGIGFGANINPQE